VESDQPPEYYYRRVRQRAMVRGIMEPYNLLQEGLQNPRTGMSDIEEAIDQLGAVKSRFVNRGSGIELSDALLEQVMQKSIARRMSGGVLTGIPTGYTSLDLTMDGYNREDLVVWVGRPGRGKSWLLLKQAHAAWTAGYKPLYISMEMGGEQNMRRILGIHSGVNPTLIKRGQVGTLALPHLERKVAELLDQRPLHMVTANFSRTVDQIANFIDNYTPDIVFIDAGYLLSPKKKRFGSSGRRETISDVIEELKELAANSRIPFVITVQFNRNAEQRRRGANQRREGGERVAVDPLAHLSLAEIGETDVIGQAATHVLGIEYPPQPLNKDTCRVFGFLKGREGESGWWACRYMQRQNSPIDLSLIQPSDPIYQQIIAGASAGSPQNRQAGQRSAAMRIQR
jgi:replicative DNA helicase